MRVCARECVCWGENPEHFGIALPSHTPAPWLLLPGTGNEEEGLCSGSGLVTESLDRSSPSGIFFSHL